MDPMDEFEFKPLTDGLGFHKKAEQIKSDIKSSFAKSTSTPSVPEPPPRSFFSTTTSATTSGATSVRTSPKSTPDSDFGLRLDTESELLGREAPKSASRSISDLIASLPPSLDFLENKESTPSASMAKDFDSRSSRRPQIFQPLNSQLSSRSSSTPATLTAAGAAATTTLGVPSAPAIPAPSAYSDRLNEGLSKAFPRMEKAKTRAKTSNTVQAVATEGETLKAIPAHLMTGVLDAMVVTGVSTLLLVCILAITHVNLTGLLTNAVTDGPTQVHIALLFISGLQLYLLTARSFFGASLGEWAFDVQLGTDHDQKLPVYPLLVAWRTILVTMTGFVVLPILSLIFRRDLAKILTGLQTYQRV
jgi:hypothetical protein